MQMADLTTFNFGTAIVDNQQFMDDSQSSGASPTGDTVQLEAGSPATYSNQGWTDMQTVSPGQFIIGSYDQNHNPMQVGQEKITDLT